MATRAELPGIANVDQRSLADSAGYDSLELKFQTSIQPILKHELTLAVDAIGMLTGKKIDEVVIHLESMLLRDASKQLGSPSSKLSTRSHKKVVVPDPGRHDGESEADLPSGSPTTQSKISSSGNPTVLTNTNEAPVDGVEQFYAIVTPMTQTKTTSSGSPMALTATNEAPVDGADKGYAMAKPKLRSNLAKKELELAKREQVKLRKKSTRDSNRWRSRGSNKRIDEETATHTSERVSSNWCEDQADDEVSDNCSFVPAETQNDEATPTDIETELQTSCMEDLVDSSRFDIASGVLVVLNSIVIGLQADWMAGATKSSTPLHFRILEVFFCIIFAVELLFRFGAYGFRMYSMSGWMWNWLDTIIVVIQVAEEIMTLAAETSNLLNTSAVRVLRMLRFCRLIRFVKLMRFISELRTLIVAIGHSFRALTWTVVLMLILMYITAVLFTQMVAESRMSDEKAFHDAKVLQKCFGSLLRSVFTLFQAIAGGISWSEITDELNEFASPLLSLFFAMYIAFMVLALLNIVTGVFVNNAITKTKENDDICMINNVREIFGNSLDGSITWQEFESHLQSPQLVSYFDYLDVDPSDARCLFSLIDTDGSGEIDCEEFLNSCLRLKGPAKALDLQLMAQEIGAISIMTKTCLKHVCHDHTQEGHASRAHWSNQHRKSVIR